MAARPIRMLVLPALAIGVLIGCVMGPEPVAPGSRSPESETLTIALAKPADTTGPSVAAAARPQVPPTCQLTRPTDPFVPPAGDAAPARPPAYYDAEWYGNAALWTMVRHDGNVWYGLSHGPAGFVQKTFWWSADFDVNHEPQPAISVTGRQLDGPGRFASPAPGTNAGADFGSAMLLRADVPSTGCWQITATYRHASLSYVAWVTD